METPVNKAEIKDNEKGILKFYDRIGKLLLICCILLCISLILPYIKGEYYDSTGSDYPFHKDLYYNGLWVMFNAFTSKFSIFLILLTLGVFILVFGSLYYLINKRKFRHVESKISMLRALQRSQIIILISGLMIFTSITLTMVLGLPPSLDPDDPLVFLHIYYSESIFLIYESIAYGLYITFFITFIIIILSLIKIYLGYKLTSLEKVGEFP